MTRAGAVTESRTAELLAATEPEDHYAEAPAPGVAVAAEAAFSPALRQRMKAALGWYAFIAPVVFGLAAAWLAARAGSPWWISVPAGAALSAIAFNLGYEWLVGGVRAKVRARAAGRGVFAGLSPAAEPQVFDGMYHYDLGFVRFENGALEFTGDRARFALDRRLVTRVWLGGGPRHIAPRKVVYIECRPHEDAPLTTFSLQSFESAYWPGTTAAARRLHRQADAWHRAPSAPETPLAACALPEVAGAPPPSISWWTASRTAGTYFMAGTSIALLSGGFDILAIYTPGLLCGWVAVFALIPHLRKPEAPRPAIARRRVAD